MSETRQDVRCGASFMRADIKSIIEEKISPEKIEVFAQALRSCGFDARQYIENNDDLLNAGLSEDEGFLHFLDWGHKEVRTTSKEKPMKGIFEFLSLKIENRQILIDLAKSIIFSQTAHFHNDDYFDVEGYSGLIDGAKRCGFRPFFLIGDSHANAYLRVEGDDARPYLPILLLCTGGSAIGLANSHSRSQYGRKIRDWLHHMAQNKIGGDLPVFMKFGQVDVEFVWNFRRINAGDYDLDSSKFQKFCDESVAKYKFYICMITENIEINRIRVCSIFPPCLSDEAWSQGYTNAHIASLEADDHLSKIENDIRKLDNKDLFHRTNMHAIYNTKLQEMCANLGIIFANDFAPLLGPAGVIAQKYVQNHRGIDHHIDPAPIRHALHSVVSQFLEVRPLGESPFSA